MPHKQTLASSQISDALSIIYISNLDPKVKGDSIIEHSKTTIVKPVQRSEASQRGMNEAMRRVMDAPKPRSAYTGETSLNPAFQIYFNVLSTWVGN